MILTVEKVKWREEFKTHQWLPELRKLEASGTFQSCLSYMVDGASEAVCNAFRTLQNAANQSERHTANLLAFLNYKAGNPGMLHIPYDGTEIAWVRINGHILHFKVSDEYEGRGNIRQGVEFVYLDRTADDEQWIVVAEELTAAANGLLPEMHKEFAEEWADWCA